MKFIVSYVPERTKDFLYYLGLETLNNVYVALFATASEFNTITPNEVLIAAYKVEVYCGMGQS